MVISAWGSALRMARNAGVAQIKSPIREARTNATLSGIFARRDNSPGVKGSLITYQHVPHQSLMRSARSFRGGVQGHAHPLFRHHSIPSSVLVSNKYLKAE